MKSFGDFINDSSISEAVKFVFDGDVNSAADNRLKSYVMLILYASMKSRTKNGLMSDEDIQKTFEGKCTLFIHDERALEKPKVFDWQNIRGFIRKYNTPKFNRALDELVDEGYITIEPSGEYFLVMPTKKGMSAIEPKYKKYYAKKEKELEDDYMD